MTLKEFNKKWIEGCGSMEEAHNMKIERYKARKRKQLEKTIVKILMMN